jgi:hypothetical protein
MSVACRASVGSEWSAGVVTRYILVSEAHLRSKQAWGFLWTRRVYRLVRLPEAGLGWASAVGVSGRDQGRGTWPASSSALLRDRLYVVLVVAAQAI